ncbi:SGNH/GDSL hydrolase family protein [Variovorax sp. LARHSF232]
MQLLHAHASRIFRTISISLSLAAVMSAAQPSGAKVSLAVMGDSNSLSYQDRISLPNPEQRGGTYRARTLNWGEVIARLRGNEVDPGPWEISGVSNPSLRWLDVLGIPVARAPRKEDYRYNFANDGADCSQLMGTRRRQAPRLVRLMDQEPQRWKHGVVVIRIGLSDLARVIDIQAQTPGVPAVQAALQGCQAYFREAVALIRSRHPDTHIVLVNAFEDSQDAAYLQRWQSAREIDNIARMFDAHDQGLRAIVAQVPNTSFFDDRAWFRRHWGARDAVGKPAFKTVAIGPKLRVTHSVGDAPIHSMLADDHNGLVWNVLWAQAMVAHLRDVARLPVTPISDEEVERLVRLLTE